MKNLIKMLLRVLDWLVMFYGARSNWEYMREEDTGRTYRGGLLADFERHERLVREYRGYVESRDELVLPSGYRFPASTEPLMSYHEWLLWRALDAHPWRGWYAEGLRERRRW